jgi:hypothetical protein
MTFFWDIVLAVLLITNVEFFMQKYWNSCLLMAGVTDHAGLEKLKNDNFDLHRHLLTIKKKFFYLRVLIWLIILREAIVHVLHLSFIIDLAQTKFFRILNYAYRSFLESSIDLIEYLGLCWLYRTQYQFSNNRAEEESKLQKNDTFESLGTHQHRIDSEQSDDISRSPKNFRGKKCS